MSGVDMTWVSMNEVSTWVVGSDHVSTWVGDMTRISIGRVGHDA